ncbi:hypothetical protein [Sinisalibacter aestuarii]|nr:hypothetical protein [Sinisalibacter aestuarii]
MTIQRSQPLFGPDIPGAAIRSFLQLTILPPSQRWMFFSAGKAASSSTLNLLFEMEFGRPLSVHFDAPHDINPSAVVHQLANHGVFSRALKLGLGMPDLLALPAERLLVVRNPYARAVSAFRYLCRSDELRAS